VATTGITPAAGLPRYLWGKAQILGILHVVLSCIVAHDFKKVRKKNEALPGAWKNVLILWPGLPKALENC
jgi:hypothetical protein